METHFAPAERITYDEVNKQQAFLLKNHEITSVLDSIPALVMILNTQRQIVFLNQAAKEKLNLNTLSDIGKRPGEAFKCIFAEKAPNGCGTGQHCMYCGAVNAILKSQKSESKESNECRIIAKNGSSIYNLDFQVTAKNTSIQDQLFTIFTLEDISDKKRRKILEKSFFHDIINIISSLQGLITLLAGDIDKDESDKYISIAFSSTNELIEEIKSHRMILNAENNDLLIFYEPVNTQRITDEVISTAIFFGQSQLANIRTPAGNQNLNFECDKQILKRVLVNMLKNAIEATPRNSPITLSVRENQNQQVVFSVHNPGFMTDEVKNQVFHRSFSTKGADRGLGTYSMKLLIENYLRGSVYFTSTQEAGTTFYCSVPKEKPR